MVSRWLVLLMTCTSLFAATLNDDVAAWTNGPYVAVIGDSIAEGRMSYHNYLGGGPSGNTNYNICARLLVASSGVLTGTNCGVAARRADQLISQGDLAFALQQKPKWLFVHVGVNDIDQGYSWSQFNGSLNTIWSTCQSSNVSLALDEVWPWTDGSDAENVTVRTWNTNLLNWVATNAGTKLVRSHDSMGQVRPSTGMLDDLSSTYDYDGVHVNASGYTNWASVIYANMQSWFTTNSRVITVRASSVVFR